MTYFNELIGQKPEVKYLNVYGLTVYHEIKQLLCLKPQIVY